MDVLESAYFAQSEHSIDDFAKDDVLAVEEVTRRGGDEELEGR